MGCLEEGYADTRQAAARIADKELAPLAAQIDQDGKIPDSVKRMLSDNGFMGICIPEEYGGAGMDCVQYSIILEEIARGCASCATFLAAHNSLGSGPIMHYGTALQKKKYLPRMASGEWVGALCLTEPHAGSDAGALSTFAEDKGSYYELSGTKSFITNGKDAHVAIVYAKTVKTKDHKGISCFIVETASPGFQVLKSEDKFGIRGSSTAQIFLDKVKVPKENMLGEPQQGFKLAMGTFDAGRIGVAAQALGIAEAAFRYAKKYATERVQFGQPIAQFQAVQFMLADMSTRIAASRLLVLHASHLRLAGVKHTKESSQAKLFAAETATMVTNKAMQILGGNGYIKEYPVERHLRDAKITELYEGTSEIQRIVIAAAELRV